MKSLRAVLLILLAVAVFPAAADDLRIACVGDSITAGRGAPQGSDYPTQLVPMLTGIEQEQNFGWIGATLTKKGDLSYWGVKFPDNSTLIDDITAHQPDIVLLLLGANDAKPRNWTHKADFVSDYCDLVKILRASRRHPTIYALVPTPLTHTAADIVPEILQNEVVPLVKQAAAKMNLPIIDLNTPMQGHPEYISDGVHPTAAGYKVMAQTIAAALKQAPTFPIRSDVFLTTASIAINDPAGTEIRYTLDGTLPTATSPQYQGPISISDTTTVTASIVKDGKVGLPATATFSKVTLAPAETPATSLIPGLTYTLYQAAPGQISGLGWDEKSFVKKGTGPGLDQSPRTQDSWYGFQYTGYIKIPADGLYTFSLHTANGSALAIGNDLVVENGGFHLYDRERSGRVALCTGLHHFALRLWHWTSPIPHSLLVSWAGPGLTKQEIPASAFSQPASTPSAPEKDPSLIGAN